MARFGYLIFFCLLFASCAQVGNISGGDEDKRAPQPIMDKINPPNETVFFNSKEVEIPFDEFIKLDNPNENIRIVPPHAKISARLKGKSLFLSWEEDLKPNTTYAIYINDAVKDITEGNDTIIQYVFSTGANLDSLKYAVKVVDAWTNLPLENVVVALYDVSNDSILNFTSTTKNGEALLNYIKPNLYKLVAFIDENRDLVPQKYEQVGFKQDSIISINEPFVDTIPIRLFKPLREPKISTATHIPANSIIIGTTQALENETIYLDGKPASTDRYTKIKSDSVRLFLPPSESVIYSLVVHSDNMKDTASVRPPINKTPNAVIVSTRKVNNAFLPSDTIEFIVNDIIESFDTSKLDLYNPVDSSFLVLPNYEIEKNNMRFFFDKKEMTNVDFIFEEGAISGLNGKTKEQLINITLIQSQKLGALNLDLTYYTEPLLLQLYLNGKEAQLIRVTDPSKKLKVTELPIGDYSFKVILDANNNGKWDTGNLNNRRQPEFIDLYSTSTKLRANWEVEITLIPTK